MTITLNEIQSKTLRKHIQNFKSYSTTEDFKKDTKDRKQRENLAKKLLTQEKIGSMSEFDFSQLISSLWASRIWTNKEYLVNQIIANSNGLENIKKSLLELYYGHEDIEKRFSIFLEALKGLGPSSITELLCLFDPKEYGIWNKKARGALKILGFEKIAPLNKYRISGKEYVKFNQLLQEINSTLIDEGFKESDLLLVDYFLYEVCESGETEKVTPPIGDVDFDHHEVRDMIEDIGLWLGFEAETEKTVAYGARVDVIWRAKIANLGIVTYIFEVHKSGQIDSLVLNLQKAQRNPTVQKLVAVSNISQLRKIENEVKGLPEVFRKSLSLWDINEVQKIHQQLSEVVASIEKLELVKRDFEI